MRDRVLSDKEIYELAARAEGVLRRSEQQGDDAGGFATPPLIAAGAFDELAVYYCYAGPDAAPDVGARASACFASAADAIARVQYTAFLRELAASPPLGNEAAAAAKQRALELAVKERNFL